MSNLKPEITSPLELSQLIVPCDQCERDTTTEIKFMRAGYDNACAVCGRLRRGKPYLPKAKFNSLKPIEAKGGRNDSSTK